MLSGWSDFSTERFSGWDIIPKQVPHVQLIVVANNPDEQAICAQYLRHNRVRYFALI
ncbi:MAG: hypothetical protein ACK4YL_05725 [Microcystis sp.]|jgi:hypothetical protein|uniref:hypothetical protein n=1 Tax=unclassified Microcystis TaxID=2643300 RepID=UPI0022BC47BB|nr:MULTISPECIES: hypothetical protein [unclassified Microcystis]MCE2668647.1 hypothetical protein [Microcystis sp. 49638_E5]MCZ8058366.1 hypothetical protein [Microcystis sp. LE19-12.2C]MDB9404403.1 hypothetical protein [Microcystis sp. CS-574]MDJ0584303.1 hypothetical protein [Microcystis sp. M49636_WE2]